MAEYSNTFSREQDEREARAKRALHRYRECKRPFEGGPYTPRPGAQADFYARGPVRQWPPGSIGDAAYSGRYRLCLERDPIPQWPSYEKPNGGNRMLNSAYTWLRDWWVRNDGTPKRPGDMNDGHLENTLKLLKESHGNAVARATAVLGKLEAHFANRPDVVEKLADLCRAIQTVEVDEMYPIWNTLSEELQKREPPSEVDFWPSLDGDFKFDGYHRSKPY